MSSLRDQLWPVFIEEVNEQIDGLESLLDTSAGEPLDINALFRHFHTVKSNGSMMDFQSIEQLAHASEDMLFVLRENNLPVDEHCTSLLLQVVDVLKQQLEHVMRFRQNPPGNPALVAELVALAEARKDPRNSDEPAMVASSETEEPGSITSAEQDDETMRINSRILDDLVASIGNMAMRENMFAHEVRNENMEGMAGRARSILPRLHYGKLADEDRETLREFLSSLNDTHSRVLHADQSIQAALTRIEQDVLELRVVPIAVVFNRLPLLVRKTSEHSGKEVTLHMEGAEVCIDKRMVDTLMEPLVHIIRNAVDHGIETLEERRLAGKNPHGSITVRAEQDAGMLVLDVMDDGKGLNAARIEAKARASGLVSPQHVFPSVENIYQLIFLPGFSTADEVTETSGRGVGMDVVKTRMTALGGRVDVVSTPGAGTRFRLQLPLSVAIQSVLLVRLGEQTCALALRAVSEIIPVTGRDLQTVCDQTVLLFRDEVLPVVSLVDLIGFETRCDVNHREVVIIRRQDEWLGLMVDEVIGQQELIVREVHEDLSQLPGLSGVSLLSDGRVVIILDTDYLINLSASTARRFSVAPQQRRAML